MQNYIEITDKNFIDDEMFLLYGVYYLINSISKYYTLYGLESNNLDVINIHSQVKYKDYIYQLTDYIRGSLNGAINSSEINIIGKNSFCMSYKGVIYSHRRRMDKQWRMDIYPRKKKSSYYIIPNNLNIDSSTIKIDNEYLKYLGYKDKIIKINNKLGSII